MINKLSCIVIMSVVIGTGELKGVNFIIIIYNTNDQKNSLRIVYTVFTQFVM